jgi:hypothetical protein
MFDRGLFLTAQAVRRQLAALPHDLYLIRLIHSATKRPFPGERLWTAEQLAHLPTLGFLRVRNREGCDIYLHPHSPAAANGSASRLRPSLARSYGHFDARFVGTEVCMLVHKTSKTMAAVQNRDQFHDEDSDLLKTYFHSSIAN